MMTASALSSHMKKKKVPVPKQSKYDIEIATIPLGVEIEGSLIGRLKKLKYVDHDVKDLAKFPYFVKEKYMIGKLWTRGFVVYEE